jgi:hypothetical protein
VIDGGKRSAYKGLLQWGRTEEIAESRERRAIYRALSVKYFGKPDHPKFVEIYGKVDDEETVYFRLVPEGGTWWEY